MENIQEILHKEIDLIQDCIKRMANNSFLLKGWTVSLVVIVLALGKDHEFEKLFPVLMLLITCFWYLDAFFLRTEKMYRKMYEWVIKNRKNTEEHLYDLDPQRFSNTVAGEVKIMFSKTLCVFYGIPFLIFLLGFLYQIEIVKLITDLMTKLKG